MANELRFVDRATELMDSVGGGKLTGKVVFNQPYAAKQHEELNYRHPRGGQAKYLTTALFNDFSEIFTNIGRYLYMQDLRNTFVVEIESLAKHSARLAPVDFNDLRRSDAVTVYDGHPIYYSRAAERGRLSTRDMRQKDKMRRSRR